MRRERGDGFDKGGVALVRTSQRHSSFKKSVRDKSQDICNYYQKKVIGQKNIQKEKEIKKFKKPKKKIDTSEKNKHGNSDTINIVKVILALLMFGDETWYVNFSASMHLCHRKDYFFEFERISPVKIYMGNNST